MATATTTNQYATVYAGPSSSAYVNIGSVDDGEPITILWREGDWIYVKYTVHTTGLYKCGYIPYGAVNVSVTDIASEFSKTTRYAGSAATTYYGGGSNYTVAGSVSYGEPVYWLGHAVKDSSGVQFAFIEYSISGSTRKKRAYIQRSLLRVSQPS